MNKKQFIIDGNNFDSLEAFYDEANKVLCPNFKEFGRNFDAFNDILRGGFETFEYDEEIDLIWKNAIKSKENLGYAETLNLLKKQLLHCHESNQNTIKENMKNVKESKGQTIFDILIEIIKENENINLILN